MAARVIQRTAFPAGRQFGAPFGRLAPPGPAPAPEVPGPVPGRVAARGPAPAPEFPGRFSVRLPAAPGGGMRLTTDTYFNAFFERHWREYAGVGRLRLRLEVAGEATVRLFGTSPLSGPV